MISIKRDLKDGGLTPEGDGERVPAVNLGENLSLGLEVKRVLVFFKGSVHDYWKEL